MIEIPSVHVWITIVSRLIKSQIVMVKSPMFMVKAAFVMATSQLFMINYCNCLNHQTSSWLVNNGYTMAIYCLITIISLLNHHDSWSKSQGLHPHTPPSPLAACEPRPVEAAAGRPHAGRCGAGLARRWWGGEPEAVLSGEDMFMFFCFVFVWRCSFFWLMMMMIFLREFCGWFIVDGWILSTRF